MDASAWAPADSKAPPSCSAREGLGGNPHLDPPVDVGCGDQQSEPPREPSSELFSASLPLSPELLSYYRSRVLEAEEEMNSLQARLDQIDVSQAALHKGKWTLQKRSDEVADLHRALSDAHVHMWEEKEKCQRLQAENDELRIQEVEDRRRIQHLLSLVEPMTQDVTYMRKRPPDTVTLFPHARAACSSSGPQPPPASTRQAAAAPRQSGRGAGGVSGVGGWSGTARRFEQTLSGDGETNLDAPSDGGGNTAGSSGFGTRVLRTVYMPNEKVDTLLLTIESLRAQLSQQESVHREQSAALLEDRRLRMAEEAARHAASHEQLQDLEKSLEQTESMLRQYTRDFLKLKHQSRQQERADKERIEGLRAENETLNSSMIALQEQTAAEVQTARSAAKAASEQYVALFQQQVSDTERTIAYMTDQHYALQQALSMRVKEHEETISKLRTQLQQLESRRRLEAEGFGNELALLHKQLSRIELRCYGQRLAAPAEPTAAFGGGSSLQAEWRAKHNKGMLKALKARVATLEASALENTPPRS